VDWTSVEPFSKKKNSQKVSGDNHRNLKEPRWSWTWSLFLCDSHRAALPMEVINIDHRLQFRFTESLQRSDLQRDSENHTGFDRKSRHPICFHRKTLDGAKGPTLMTKWKLSESNVRPCGELLSTWKTASSAFISLQIWSF
jgi:hypothetical protein